MPPVYFASKGNTERGDSVHPGRRRFLLSGPVLAGALAAAPAAMAQAWRGEGWTATWGCAPAGPPPAASTTTFNGQTIRLIVRASIGGNRLRVRLSNEMGSTPLTIGAAQIGLRASGSSVVAGSSHPLTFGGSTSVTIPSGAPALSDPVPLAIPPHADLAVSLYFPGSVPATTLHGLALQATYVSSAGNFTANPTMPVSGSTGNWPFLTEIDVDGAAPCIVAIGDSITDGVGSTSHLNRRWPDYLARRLQAELGAYGRIGVVNRGISGNQLLREEAGAPLAGRDVLERFDRDVLATAGVRAVVACIGINDICYSSGASLIKPAELIAGYRQIIARAHTHGVVAIGATLPPFTGFVYYNEAREAVRRAANDWMRGTGEFDLLLDWEAVLRDPEAPGRLRADYNSKDWLHPNDAGYEAMAGAVPLQQLLALLG